mmetsp:Transcript_14270/g.53719  ORF Transcript_14270/g.53719 Transcript_14270/m.53719 type:complete len:113 (+) Transcript_14270:602-940(+)
MTSVAQGCQAFVEILRNPFRIPLEGMASCDPSWATSTAAEAFPKDVRSTKDYEKEARRIHLLGTGSLLTVQASNLGALEPTVCLGSSPIHFALRYPSDTMSKKSAAIADTNH